MKPLWGFDNFLLANALEPGWGREQKGVLWLSCESKRPLLCPAHAFPFLISMLWELEGEGGHS